MDVLTLDMAKKSAEHYLFNMGKNIGLDLMLANNYTKDNGDFYVFIYNTKEFIETGNISSALTGNSPLFIDKNSGKIYESGTAYPLEHYIKKFEKGNMELFNEINFNDPMSKK